MFTSGDQNHGQGKKPWLFCILLGINVLEKFCSKSQIINELGGGGSFLIFEGEGTYIYRGLEGEAILSYL